MRPKLGIIAGGGELPGEIIKQCLTSGRDFFVIALKDQADPDLLTDVPHEWIRLGAAGKSIKLLRQHEVKELVLAGSVKRPTLSALRPDLRSARIFAKTGAAGLGDDGLLSALISALQDQEGFTLVGSDDLLPDLVAPEGVLGRVSPSKIDHDDIATGIKAARELGCQDIGQAVVVRNGCVIGREDEQGTDALLKAVRPDSAGVLSGVLVKTAKPQQERRADLPTIGPETVEGAYSAGLAGIALEAHSALILDRSKVSELADHHGMFVVGVKSA